MSEKLKATVFVITANGLADGRVRYLRADRSWGQDFDSALLIEDPSERDELVALIQSTQATDVTGCYAFDVGISEDDRRVLSAREQIRAAGEATTRRRLGLEA